jgi:hypothetical protein
MTGAGNVKGQTSRLPPGAADIPLFNRDDYAAPSVFLPQSLLREARRQKALPESRVPPVCVLDPDGDLVAYARRQFGATPSPHWACYHTQMWEWGSGDNRFGIIGFVVGGPFAVLVAEQLFACGCELLISITSAGQIVDVGSPPYYVLIDRALRDEGTSHHYLPPSDYASADPALIALAREATATRPRRSRRRPRYGQWCAPTRPPMNGSPTIRSISPTRRHGRSTFHGRCWRTDARALPDANSRSPTSHCRTRAAK